MNANEFFKAMGVKSVKQFLENDNIRTKEMHDNLKRLIESHELVENWGGLDDAKFALQLVRYPERLKQAIADVESCLD